jgi:hypothetical protein
MAACNVRILPATLHAQHVPARPMLIPLAFGSLNSKFGCYQQQPIGGLTRACCSVHSNPVSDRHQISCSHTMRCIQPQAAELSLHQSQFDISCQTHTVQYVITNNPSSHHNPSVLSWMLTPAPASHIGAQMQRCWQHLSSRSERRRRH